MAGRRVDGGDDPILGHLAGDRQEPDRSPGSTSWPATNASSATASACSSSNPNAPTASSTTSASLTSPDTSALVACGSSQAQSGLPGRS